MIDRKRYFVTPCVLLAVASGISAQTVPQIQSPFTSSATTSVNDSQAKAALSSNSIVTAVPEDFAKLKIAPGFLLQVDVYDIPELSTQLRVGESGDITLPLAGQIHVAGDTLSEAEQAIAAKFVSTQMVKKPQVTVNVDQYAPFIVSVLGEVQSPGRIQLQAPHSLLDILSLVGGETPLAGRKIEIRHNVGGAVTVSEYVYGSNSNGSSIANVMVHDGDTVIVPRAGIVYVLGAVNKPGGYIMQEDGRLNVEQALSLAVGTSLVAKVGDIRIIRRNSDGTLTEIPVDYRAISKGKVPPPELQNEDIVYVPVSKVKAIFTSGSALVSEAAYATVYAVK